MRVKDPRGFAQLRECGGLVLHSRSTDGWVNQMMPMLAQAGIPFKYWDLPQLEQKFGEHSPFRMDLSSFAPPKRIDDLVLAYPTRTRIAASGHFLWNSQGTLATRILLF